MPSPSRGGGPAAMPKYQRIAAALRGDLDRAARTPGGKLPSERSLAARYQVNRQTIRAALQQLREDGLVVTGRRGTRPALEPAPAEEAAANPASADRPAAARPPAPGSACVIAAAFTQSWLTLVTVPPSLAGLLGMGGGSRTLVHHQRDHGPAGETLRHAATYFSPAVTAADPELSRYRDRAADVRDEDLEPLHRWLDRVQAQGRVAETITMTRTSHPPAASPVCGLSVRRTLHDPAGRLLAVTDLSFPTWDRLTFHRDRRDHAATGFRVT
ncbi:winged helix-turn-helix domain-containing protein [Streptomyces sp. H27-S2]|uniref:winged helix-turn-helix domain-containing protein n=1 Tax=Streptomyces antarcticus TaxID=2996458 RepID=UPI00226FC0C6|nr:GntR family transcriptional regulator [Streptomyces sp. H27-S2]MCY0949546.1 GntR family transcriptional regulator [Streptomyces sp. H27-S2]